MVARCKPIQRRHLGPWRAVRRCGTDSLGAAVARTEAAPLDGAASAWASRLCYLMWPAFAAATNSTCEILPSLSVSIFVIFAL